MAAPLSLYVYVSVCYWSLKGGAADGCGNGHGGGGGGGDDDAMAVVLLTWFLA